jgi:TfoX/Sxy family transcriptional regulator of competence genes
MATRQSTVDLILEQIAAAGNVSARKMFGEYGLYCGGKIVALVCDDQLLVKPTEGGRAFAPEAEQVPAYRGAKPSLLIEADRWEDADWLAKLIAITAAELPAPKARKRNKRS